MSLWRVAAAAAAKSLQSCPTLCDSIDGNPLGSSVPGIIQARVLEWAAISFSNAWKWKVKVKSLSRVRLLATPWIAAYQAPPSMGFSKQEYWSRVPLPSPFLPTVVDMMFIWIKFSHSCPRWRVLTKHGPLENGMANHLSILALGTYWTVWKNTVLACVTIPLLLTQSDFCKLYKTTIMSVVEALFFHNVFILIC